MIEPDRRFLTIIRAAESIILIIIENRAEAGRIMYNEGSEMGGGYLMHSIRTYRGPPILAEDIDAQIRDATRRYRDTSLMLAQRDCRHGRELNDEMIQLRDKLQPANIAALEDVARVQQKISIYQEKVPLVLESDKDLKVALQSLQVDEQMNQRTDKDSKSLSGRKIIFFATCAVVSNSLVCFKFCSFYLYITYLLDKKFQFNLDEFDVFMVAAVNRRISMQMMIETAREADYTQDASSVSPGPDVRVHRLQDPERGQGILDETNSF
ncbi:hypothetical protein Glove_21g316 [Diversispora epigaea]|uniref:Uncharacterized protein n=1 Tax=Diversispora epigaea TaxID=1348612 RepID=A0A397JMW7_9GLOM|nr:hypothetical protein Glove_21g316 [Diversispora epigaea]